MYRLALTVPQRDVLGALLVWFDSTGRGFRAVQDLAQDTDRSERQVQRILRQLEKAKVLEAVTYRTGGRGNATVYELRLGTAPRRPPPEPDSERVTSERHPLREGKGDTEAGKGDAGGPKGRHLGVTPANPIGGDVLAAPQPLQFREGDGLGAVHRLRPALQIHREVLDQPAPPTAERQERADGG
jgi:hypothetical protein